MRAIIPVTMYMSFKDVDNTSLLQLDHGSSFSHLHCSMDTLYTHESMMIVDTVYPEILATFLIWRFGSQDQNHQIYIDLLTILSPCCATTKINYSLILHKSPNLMIANISGYMVIHSLIEQYSLLVKWELLNAFQSVNRLGVKGTRIDSDYSNTLFFNFLQLFNQLKLYQIPKITCVLSCVE